MAPKSAITIKDTEAMPTQIRLKGIVEGTDANLTSKMNWWALDKVWDTRWTPSNQVIRKESEAEAANYLITNRIIALEQVLLAMLLIKDRP